MTEEKIATFEVYNASAGSGKTFTLVKEYLKIILSTEDVFKFQSILAITFTNKAAAEMKTRVLKQLTIFSSKDKISNDGIGSIIITETSLSEHTIKKRSKNILEAILRNYTAFAITTIDSFTHKIIKNFAFDLGLNLNFEVQLDAEELLSESVALLVSKIGNETDLTRALIDFSLERVDNDKAWDITQELEKFSKLLLNEDDAKQFKKLNDKTLDDFNTLKKNLKNQLQKNTSAIKSIAKDTLELISNNNLEHKNFIRGTLPKFFVTVIEKTNSLKLDKNFKTLDNNFSKNSFYTKTASDFVKNTIDTIIREIENNYNQIKDICKEITLIRLSLNSITPLAVLNNISQELQTLKEDNNIRLNAEFNSLISEHIKDQPAPFIYERIGQRYNHYFIDEMQDTSLLQWQNLIPLIENALAQANTSLMLVGDGKQAIYRWRGGKAEQFITLGTKEVNNPFPIEKSIKTLKTNYRSYSEIINFTNNFFQHVSNYINNFLYKDLYIEGNQQLENNKKGGYVSVNFIQKEQDKEDNQLRYAKKTLKIIKEIEQNGFKKDDICILVRKKAEGVTIANFLTDNGIEIESSETLLVKNSKEVQFLINFTKSINNPKDKNSLFNSLYFLSNLFKQENKQEFIYRHIDIPLDKTIEIIKKYNVSIELNKYITLPLFEKFQYLINAFNLNKDSDAYIQEFLELTLEQQQKGKSIQEFTQFWEKRKEKISLTSSNTKDKVRIMTIHKSKGLEFPVVIFPGDLNIYKQLDPKVWITELNEQFGEFNELLINQTKELSLISPIGKELENEINEALELDNFNLLYVALTRPKEQLYIITDTEEKENYYSSIFKSYCKKNQPNQEQNSIYTYGKQQKNGIYSPKNNLKSTTIEYKNNISKEYKIELLPSESKYWDDKRGKAIAYGNKTHEILSKIKSKNDVDYIISKSINNGVLDKEEAFEIKELIDQIVNHEKIKQFYNSSTYEIYNERKIKTKEGAIIIPDRLAIKKNKVTIIEYKTGHQIEEHIKQVENYSQTIESLKYEIENIYIVYISKTINVIQNFKGITK